MVNVWNQDDVISKVHICIHVALAMQHKENNQLETVLSSSRLILKIKRHVSYSHEKSKQRSCHSNVNLCSVDRRQRLYKTWDEPTRPTWAWRLPHKESVNSTGTVPLAFSLYIHVNHLILDGQWLNCFNILMIICFLWGKPVDWCCVLFTVTASKKR